MRVDFFMSAVNLCKNRSRAADMCDCGVIFVNEKAAKKSSFVKIGDVIRVNLLSGAKFYEVLDLPRQKTVPKSQNFLYFREISQKI